MLFLLELVVFVGLPGSGKSSFYRARYAGTHALVSKDLLRNARDPRAREARLIEEALASGRSVVVDDTNPRREDRAALVELGRRFGARLVCWFFDESRETCLERNRGRTGRARVPDVAIHVAARRLVVPSPAEGFDEVHVVRSAGPTDAPAAS